MAFSKRHWIVLLLAAVLLAAGCGGAGVRSPSEAPVHSRPLSAMGYAIQVGAFASLENASRLSDELRHNGLEAYHFADDDGLFKVRFGSFASKSAARRRAEALERAGVIEAHYIVGPEDYGDATSETVRRTKIVKTARRYLGLPYRWGGDSIEEGFDCSGLTMTVYRLNGLNLPRSSRQQYRAGDPVNRGGLRPGDLVFFATSGTGSVSHVGIYTGGGRFIHAPKSGGTIRTASMNNTYFRRRYVGARSYFR